MEAEKYFGIKLMLNQDCVTEDNITNMGIVSLGYFEEDNVILVTPQRNYRVWVMWRRCVTIQPLRTRSGWVIALFTIRI